MRRINVLLVEDNRDHSFLSRRAFENYGEQFEVIIAVSGRDALNDIERREFDIVFADHQLPDINGLSLLKKIHAQHPTLSVIITTGRGSEELAVATFREGAADYIIKDSNYFDLLPIAALRTLETRQKLNGHIKRPPFSAHKIYEQILSASTELLGVHASSLMVYNDTKGFLEIKAHRGLSHNYLALVQPRLGESIEGQAIVKAKPLLLDDIDDTASPYVFKEIAEVEGIRSAMSVPFSIDGSTRGVLNLYSHNKDFFQKKDQQVAQHLVKLSALALKNLKLYYREHHIAETLQKSHFPEIARRFENWEFAHRYRVSMEEALLGGDFYDMFPVADNQRAVVVADVSGKGISAAAQTAMVKYTLRSYALDDPDPASVLAKTHDAFCSYMQSEHFVTIFFGLINPTSNMLRYCSGGHPPALFFSKKQGKVFSLDDVHMPIGAWHTGVTFNTSTIVFEPGDCLLIYTDGLTDCRQDGLNHGALFGQSNLERLFAQATKTGAEEIAGDVMETILKYSAGKLRDDLAFFVIKLCDDEVA